MHELKARYRAVLGERHRISQDIHDTFAQNPGRHCAAARFGRHAVGGDPAGVRSRLDEACNLTRYSLSEARRTLTDLRSDELEGTELTIALPEIARRLVGAAAVRTAMHVAGTPQRLGPVTEKALIRIFQEAMANALKHSHAGSIDIQLRYEEAGLVLAVKDDGRGFDAERAIPLAVGHYGLTGHARAGRADRRAHRR